MTEFVKEKNIVNKKFGRLTIIAPTDERQNEAIIYKCLCDCGKVHYARSTLLRNGSIRSCGCLRNEIVAKTNRARLKNLSGQTINGIFIVRMSSKRTVTGKGVYCFAICPQCKHEWEVKVCHLKTISSCRRCFLCRNVSKTATNFLNKLEECLGTTIIREYRVGHKFFDGYIPKYNLLIESDGRYYHSLGNNIANDLYKEQLALESGFSFIRVDNDNYADYVEAINKVSTFIKDKNV